MENIKVSMDNLDALLDKFFAGETTCAQEKALEDFFRSGVDIPSEYEYCREMFGWYASGMDEQALPSETAQLPEPEGFSRRLTLWWSSAAAVVLLALAFGFSHNFFGAMPDPVIVTDNYLTRDGKVIQGEDEISADLDASIMAAISLEQEIDFEMSKLKQN